MVPEGHAVTKHQHGTTTLAFIYQGGIVCAVDSRSSMGPAICIIILLCYYFINSNIFNNIFGITVVVAIIKIWYYAYICLIQKFNQLHKR